MDAAVTASLPAQRAPPLLTITLLGQPKGKVMARPAVLPPNLAKGRLRVRAMIFPDKETAIYEGMLRYAGSLAMRDAGIEAPLDGPLRVRVTAVFSIPMSWSGKNQQRARDGLIRPTGRPDWENVAKSLDAINKVVWRDDSLIVEGAVRKFYGLNPMLHVEVWRWSPPTLL